MAQLQEQILAYLPPAVRSLLEGGSKRELLKKVDATLLVFDEQVLHVESGKSASIASELIPIDASSLAIALRRTTRASNCSRWWTGCVPRSRPPC